MGAALLLSFLLLLCLSLPISMSLIGASLAAIIAQGRFPVETVFHTMTGGLTSYILLSIPFFIVAGELMNSGGITTRIFDFCNQLVGRIPGGLGHANVFASIIFAGMSGSAVADAGGLGAIEMKAMKEKGFDDDFSAAVTAASSTIGPIIPPSIPMIVYGVSAEVSVGKLFAGGMIPGLLMGIMMSILVYIIAVKRKYPRLERFSIKEVGITFYKAFLPIMTPAIIIGGIMGGIFTPTEAACIAVVYAMFLGFVVYHELNWKGLREIIFNGLVTTSTVTFIIAGAAAFAWLIAIDGIPKDIANWISGVNMPVWLFLFAFNVFFLILGCFMEALSILIIIVPVLMPIMAALHLDPLHMGVVLVLNLMIGLITPPVGMSLFVVSKVGNVKLEKLCVAIIPFIIPLVIVLVMITYIPSLVTWLPSVIFAK
ncbi:MAG: TRAP transporter large permease [Treponemataceae bacterium]